MSATSAVIIEGLHKKYRTNRALCGVELEVRTGEIRGLLGPNGAGKTTLVKILTTLLEPDHGSVLVNGWNVVEEPEKVRSTIGLAGQYSTVDGLLTGFENLYLLAKLRGVGRRTARRVADDLLSRFRLADVAGRPAGTYSGGMRRRLDLAAALVGSPPLVVLDEPTTGLDPESRLDTWEAVAELAADGTTILLTTQYLEEADRLADRITVIDRGLVVAEGTSDALKASAGHRLVMCVAEDHQLDAATRAAARATGTTPTVDRRARRVEAATADGRAALARALTALEGEDVEVLEIGLGRCTLDDVFLGLTGHARRTAA
ncbi:ATP-binding cassette domain-containing protein [Streptomyces scabiei]|uniref:ABC transporter ATP-binding protein n=1 Tax=Streptomyces scabiei TaxID=1930 RepID=UPI0024A67A38|nr:MULTISPECIES: ATP-binding cassette domain-containing protein [Streptomyces]MDW8478096.1 ATP-binding cassette domain-containing protein [Streptomyces scabiei]MDX2572086.1 ATP-binding cassette domain-containing protein [Streptomyces scabiei]MDX2631559.1 ATP-binding cassette domain-containing protein [Streptomyces scabiei]MDX2687316.1 ATP-binding cassette domain-containing protein [Streptomyces scabiei]MDX2809135.1 ATP-binding cassette domain-containing protein [Streptomyces scabiei]